MARPLFKKMRKHGFTLVELLIVVAIIGVLSTVAVPTFRRMIAKSKKTEAKVNLGGLYTAQQAFLAEYGAFGNNLSKIGFQVDGNAATDIYTVGFPTPGCTTGLNYAPTQASTIGTAINQVFPSYYATALNTIVGAPNKVCASTAGPNSGLPTTDVDGTANPSVGVYDQNGTANTFNRFLASATGPIWPGVNRAEGTLSKYDIWTIDQNRNLVNGNDGTQ